MRRHAGYLSVCMLILMAGDREANGGGECMPDKTREAITLVAEIAGIIAAIPIVGSAVVYLWNKSMVVLYCFIVASIIVSAAWIIRAALRKRRHASFVRLRDEQRDLCATVSQQYYAFVRLLTADNADMARRMKNGVYAQHPNQLLDDTVRILEGSVEALSSLLSRWAGRTVCVCVKLVEFDDIGSGPYDGVVSTWARSTNSGHSRLLASDENEIRVSQNTDFKKILGFDDEGRVQGPFYCGNLVEYAARLKAAGQEYENSTKNWEQRYRATIVVPICADRASLRSIDTSMLSGEVHSVVGFLCADTMSELVFTKEMEIPYVNLMTTFADGLYTVVASYKAYDAAIQQQANKEE